MGHLYASFGRDRRRLFKVYGVQCFQSITMSHRQYRENLESKFQHDKDLIAF